jgi:uncharacterized protein YyaL (SSP411 family)
VERAGQWLLESGIREADGGVARYHFLDRRQNAKVSTEITGYAVSAFSYLHHLTKEQRYLDAAVLSSRFLCDKAWDDHSSTMPFEIPDEGQQGYAYFFDLGIIVRGLLSAWRITGDTSFLGRAQETGLSMAYDFMAEEGMHPILTLPDKQPLDYDAKRWSRSPGCYQLKSALAWKDLAEATGQPALRQPYERMLEYSLATHESFLPGHEDPAKVMDRLHAYSYFLEAILPVCDRPAVQQALRYGIPKVSALLREIRPTFERSDVNAQLLRVRLWADRFGVVPLDEKEAADEARSIAEFSREDDGAYLFGRVENGKELLPFTNPVSASFCLQALAMWEGDRDIPVTMLI